MAKSLRKSTCDQIHTGKQYSNDRSFKQLQTSVNASFALNFLNKLKLIT